MDVSAITSLPVTALEALFDDMPDVAFFIKDSNGRYVCVNQSLVVRCGMRHKRELLGRRVQDVFARDLADSYEAQDAAVLARGLSIRNRLELHRRAGGRTGWCLTTKLPLRDHRGTITGIIGVSRDLAAPGADKNLPQGIARAMDELAARCGDARMSPAILARRAGMPAPRFARIVKRIFQLTPGQLISQSRINAAANLLGSTKHSVAEIALACGFCDHSAFTRAFRQATGVTPTQFRDSH
jgi:PAS domain S-box-containing protein